MAPPRERECGSVRELVTDSVKVGVRPGPGGAIQAPRFGGHGGNETLPAAQQVRRFLLLTKDLDADDAEIRDHVRRTVADSRREMDELHG